MRRLIIIAALWAALIGLGMAGLFSNQTTLMSVCFVAWTPLAIAFGYSLSAAKLKIIVADAEPPAERVRRVPEPKVRERKVI